MGTLKDNKLMTPPSILTFVAHYLPGYKSGGPIQSIANLAAQLGANFNFLIVTRDRDAGDEKPYPAINPEEWRAVGNAQVRYMSFRAQTPWGIAKVMRRTPHTMVYLNSFFNWRSSILPLLLRKIGLAPRTPLLLAPRGEFSKGALSLKSSRKRAFLVVAKLIGLHNDVIWQASSMHEANDIRAAFGNRLPIHIASDLPRLVHGGLAHEVREQDQLVRLVFLSRISPMKNLNFVIDVLSRVKVPVTMSIVGPVSDQGYWEECKSKIGGLPRHVNVRYDGVVVADKVPSVISKSDLFFLPTLGENFGHVIIEALGAGTPALISDQTPWQDLESEGCGWVLPLGDAQIFADRIDAVYAESVETSAIRRQAALNYAQRFQTSGGAVDDNRRMFAQVLAQKTSDAR